MRSALQAAIIAFAILFVLACWVYVVGHQMDIPGFHNLAGTSAGLIAVTYTITGMSVSVMIALAVKEVFRE